ncbi:MAG: hypothetical protein R3A52_05735 [Polyangiales bacterium]
MVLFYCVTGRLPFESEDPRKVLLMHVGDPRPTRAPGRRSCPRPSSRC